MINHRLSSAIILSLLILSQFLPIAEASCKNLQPMWPAEGTTVRILAGQCMGRIRVKFSHIAIIFEPGAGVQDGAYIKFPTAGQLTNFSVRVRNVTWNLTASLFNSGSILTTLELVRANFSFKDSTIEGSGLVAAPAPIGLLVESDIRSGPALTSSNFEVDNCNITGTKKYAISFKGPITSSTISIMRSSVTAKGGGTVPMFGIDITSKAFTNSKLFLGDSNVTASSSADNNAYAINIRIMSMTRAFRGSTVTLSRCRVLGTTDTVNPSVYAFGIYLYSDLTNTTTTTVHGSVVTGYSHSGVTPAYSFLLQLDPLGQGDQTQVGQVTLTQTNFFGRSDKANAPFHNMNPPPRRSVEQLCQDRDQGRNQEGNHLSSANIYDGGQYTSRERHREITPPPAKKAFAEEDEDDGEKKEEEKKDGEGEKEGSYAVM